MSFFRPSNVARFTAPPTPASPAEDAIEGIDRQLAEIAAVPPPVRTPELWAKQDRLLDLRNAIRPARVASRPSVPVIPGRTS